MAVVGYFHNKSKIIQANLQENCLGACMTNAIVKRFLYRQQQIAPRLCLQHQGGQIRHHFQAATDPLFLERNCSL